jgi:hypothetical protein
MISIPNLINALGGSTAVAAALGLPGTTVASWKSRRSIPCGYWPQLVELGHANKVEDLTLQRLAELSVGVLTDRGPRRGSARATSRAA